MSTEEYPEEHEPRGGSATGAFIPLALLSITLIVLLGWQVIKASSDRNSLEGTISRQEPTVTQAQQLESSLKALAQELLTTAQTDDTAKAIAAKYIHPNSAPAPSP
ncbi:MAG: hypothetical protein ABSE62_05860 [Chthoniobacteraceae bacterium]|jgi:hypothetical protein